MAGEPVTISWDELGTRKVDQRLRETQAMNRNRAYAQLDADSLPQAAPPRATLLRSTTFWMTVLGLAGGILAWGCGWLTQVKSAEQRAFDLERGIHRIEFQRDSGALTAAAADATVRMLEQQGRANPYFAVVHDPTLSPEHRQARLDALERRAGLKRFAMNVVSFGLSGMLLALCLGIAEPITERNLPAAIRNGAAGGALGLLGGVVVSLFVDRLYRAAAGDAASDASSFTARDILARSLAWGVLGLFLTIGPGLILGNVRRLLIGLAGGLLGGAIGGALFDPVGALAGPEVSRLIALGAIGALAGAGTGLIENAAKTGWLRVTAGLIAGKQFILYRNPTYVGSSPDSQIYLFRDPRVGRRHAALHLVPGGVEIEDLPLGGPTLVNGSPVSRARLHNGDRIAIGATMFLFQEKART